MMNFANMGAGAAAPGDNNNNNQQNNGNVDLMAW